MGVWYGDYDNEDFTPNFWDYIKKAPNSEVYTKYMAFFLTGPDIWFQCGGSQCKQWHAIIDDGTRKASGLPVATDDQKEEYNKTMKLFRDMVDNLGGDNGGKTQLMFYVVKPQQEPIVEYLKKSAGGKRCFEPLPQWFVFNGLHGTNYFRQLHHFAASDAESEKKLRTYLGDYQY